MNNTERDENQDTISDEREAAAREAEESSPKHKLPFMPDSRDDSPLGSTDQHSDA